MKQEETLQQYYSSINTEVLWSDFHYSWELGCKMELVVFVWNKSVQLQTGMQSCHKQHWILGKISPLNADIEQLEVSSITEHHAITHTDNTYDFIGMWLKMTICNTEHKSLEFLVWSGAGNIT